MLKGQTMRPQQLQPSERGCKAVENDADNDEGWLTDDIGDEREEMEVQVLA
jgi:hypothetical protein